MCFGVTRYFPLLVQVSGGRDHQSQECLKQWWNNLVKSFMQVPVIIRQFRVEPIKDLFEHFNFEVIFEDKN